jgi:hypothetical protein
MRPLTIQQGLEFGVEYYCICYLFPIAAHRQPCDSVLYSDVLDCSTRYELEATLLLAATCSELTDLICPRRVGITNHDVVSILLTMRFPSRDLR